MWPSSFGGFLRGGALCCPLARSRRSWTAVPRLGPALRRRHFGSNPRRFSRRRLTLACAAAAHGSMVLPACCSTCIWLCAITGLGDWEGQRWWQGQQQRVQGESGSRPHPSTAWTPSPPSQIPAVLSCCHGLGDIIYPQGPREGEQQRRQQPETSQTISCNQGFFFRTRW